VPLRDIPVSRWRRDWFRALLLIVFVFIAYAQVFRADFIWDDESHLTQNPCVVGPLGLREIWTTTQAVYYPLVLTTFWALHKVFGLNPLPYHLLNISFHVASAILLWRILQVLRVRGAWLGAALWALHPVMVQSVAWVTELKNTQSCVFYLFSILFFLKWEDQGGAVSRPPERRTGDRRSLVFALSLLFFLLATLSKTSVVMLPFVLALCFWWMQGKIRWRDTLVLAPFALISALASAWTIWEQRFHARAVGPDWAQTFPERLIIAGKAIWFYLGKLMWPQPLIFIYPRWDVDSSKVVAYLPLLAAIAGLVALWFIHAKGRRALFFAAAYYVTSLFPVLGFFSVYFFRYSFVSDHFQYLASMGPLALIGAGITTLLGRFCETPADWVSHPDTVPRSGSTTIATPRRRLVLSAGLCGILLVSLGFLTWRQTAQYRDLSALYTATVQKNPGCWMAHYNLGIVLSEQGEADQAIDHYRRAVALRPDYAEAHYNLGRLLVEHGQLANAIAHYERAAAIDPADAEAQNNLGVTLFGIGRTDDAIAHYQKALEIRPDYAEASCNLANALIAKNDFDGAIARYRACLAAIPDQGEAQYNLASALLHKGRTDEAIVEYQKVLQMHPESADAHANLGSAWLAKRRVRDAIAEYTKALQISPENLAALSNLAWLLATSSDSSLRNGSEAVRLAERADSTSSRSETHPTVLRILAAAYAEAGQFAEAKETAQHALEAANIQGNTTLADALQGELALYDLGLPYHK
jgi:tetratricopeptide (TPR) repeat protein